MSGQSHGILRKFAVLLGAQWFREVLQSIFLVVLARTSSTTYGEFMLAFSIAQVVVFVAEFGLNQHLVALLARREMEKAELLLEVSILKGGLLVVGMVGAWAFAVWQGYAPSLRLLVLVVVAGVGFQALTTSFYVAYQVEGRQHLEAATRAVSASLGFGYGLTTLLVGLSPVWVACYLAIETLMGLGVSVAEMLGRAKAVWRRPNLGRLINTAQGGLVFVLMAFAAILYNKNNIFFLQRFAGAEGVAQYSVTWQMVDGVSVLISNLLLKNVLFPLFVNLNRIGSGELAPMARSCARWLLLASLPVMFVLCVESDRFILIIYGEGYRQAVDIQKILTLTVLFSFLHNLAAYLMMSVKRERLLLAFYLGGLAFNLFICGVWIPSNPLHGAVGAIVLTKGFMAMLTVGYCQWRIGLIPWITCLQIGVAVAVGATLYSVGSAVLFREAGEVLALTPAMGLAVWWYRQKGTTFVEK
jgi:O-antigen/teichoic acid export membrane protein